MMRAAPVLLAALLLTGSITLAHGPSGGSVTPRAAEVTFGALAPGSSAGPNSTNGSASVAGALLSTTTHVLYLNNTNATGAWFARLEVVDSSGLAGLSTLQVGIRNGTASVEQVASSLGTLTKRTGPLVRLEPGSANRIYVTQAVAGLATPATVWLDVVAADGADEAATVVTKARIAVA